MNMAAMGEPSVTKVIELIGSSPTGWEDAAANAVKEAAKTIRNIRQVYVKECTAKICFNVFVMPQPGYCVVIFFRLLM